jgi:ribosomal protein S12 methylthiotransferase
LRHSPDPGAHHSYDETEILKDVQQAAGRGARELIIVAQDITAYGQGKGLSALLEKICAVEGPQWVRLMYAHPDHVTDDFIEAMARLPKIVPYLDIPFQHADAGILRAMNRQGSADVYLELIARLRARIPGIALRSTFMVGFPGETGAGFETLLDFIQKAGWTGLALLSILPRRGLLPVRSAGSPVRG